MTLAVLLQYRDIVESRADIAEMCFYALKQFQLKCIFLVHDQRLSTTLVTILIYSPFYGL